MGVAKFLMPRLSSTFFLDQEAINKSIFAVQRLPETFDAQSGVLTAISSRSRINECD
jgi:hypothetical protein